MKGISFILVLLLGSQLSLAQTGNKKYPSKQEELYRKTQTLNGFEPASIADIKDLTNHVGLRKQSTNNPFVSIWERPRYYKYYDSLEQICRDELWKVTGVPNKALSNMTVERYLQYTDSLEKAGVVPKVRDEEAVKAADLKFSACLDSIDNLIDHDSIAGINPRYILRYDSLGAKRVLLYKDLLLSEFDYDLWLAISEDNGKSWHKYFSGLIERQFYYIKPDPGIKMIKNDSTIQLEVAIVRQLESWSRPIVSLPDYELVEDNLVLDLSLNSITSDLDHDGLTDLIEKRLLTDPRSKDTDHDGIDDAVDTNPRLKSVKDKYANLIRYLLEPSAEGDTLIPFIPVESKKIYRERKSIRYIVTDDVHVMGLGKTNHTYIILKTKEHLDYQKQNPGSLDEVTVSPFFEVDNMPGTWNVRLTFGFYGYTCIITESKKGWIVKFIDHWIS